MTLLWFYIKIVLNSSIYCSITNVGCESNIQNFERVKISLYQLPQEEILNTALRAKLGQEKLSADESISADIHILT